MTEQVNKSNIPKVSIGMPVYNGENYIRDALDSLLCQTFTDFELIISDNSSTDDTESICQEYTNIDSRIKYIRQSQNIGALDNFNFVLKYSRSNYFMWAACDDTWSQHWLEKLIFGLDATGAGAIFGQVCPVDQHLNPYPHIAVGQTFAFDSGRLSRRIKFFLDYEGRGKANLFYSLFRKEIIENLQLNKTKYDYSILYKLLSVSTFQSVEGVYLFKRDHAGAAGNKDISAKLTSKVINKIFPIHLKLLSEYLSSCAYFEKLLLLALLPVKFAIAYYWIFAAYIKRKYKLTNFKGLNKNSV